MCCTRCVLPASSFLLFCGFLDTTVDMLTNGGQAGGTAAVWQPRTGGVQQQHTFRHSPITSKDRAITARRTVCWPGRGPLSVQLCASVTGNAAVGFDHEVAGGVSNPRFKPSPLLRHYGARVSRCGRRRCRGWRRCQRRHMRRCRSKRRSGCGQPSPAPPPRCSRRRCGPRLRGPRAVMPPGAPLCRGSWVRFEHDKAPVPLVRGLRDLSYSQQHESTISQRWPQCLSCRSWGRVPLSPRPRCSPAPLHRQSHCAAPVHLQESPSWCCMEPVQMHPPTAPSPCCAARCGITRRRLLPRLPARWRPSRTRCDSLWKQQRRRRQRRRQKKRHLEPCQRPQPATAGAFASRQPCGRTF